MKKSTKLAVVAGLIGLLGTSGLSDTYYFAGSGVPANAAGNWNVLANWVDSSQSYAQSIELPTTGDDVIVNSGRKLYVSDTQAATSLKLGHNNVAGTLFINTTSSALTLDTLKVGTAGGTGAGQVNHTAAGSVTVNSIASIGVSAYGKYILSAGTLNMGDGSSLTLGSGGVSGTPGTMTIDGGTLNTVASSTGGTTAINGAGKLELLSGNLNVVGGAVTNLFSFNTALIEVSGGAMDLDAQLRLGNSTANDTEFRVVGDTATISMLAINNKEAAASTHGTFKFVLGTDGVSAINVEEWMFLSGSKLVVDGTAYTGGAQTITLFNAAGGLLDTIAEGDITIEGFDSSLSASVVQNSNGLVTLNVIPEPATIGLFTISASVLFLMRRYNR